MTNGIERRGWLCAVAVAVFSFLLVACSGDTGAQGPAGPAGPAGPTGPVTGGAVTSLQLEITSATLGTTSTVDFKVTDQNGIGFVGLPASTLEVMIAKLVPGTNGDTDHWQSYVNATDTPSGVGPGTTPTIVAARDSGGTLVDHGDGTYTYTFGFDITNVTQPVAVSFDSALTHRIAIDIRSSTLPQANNAIYTWQPSTGATAGIPGRAIVEIASCNECHDRLTAHGGPRQDTRLCVTCHNPGSTEANSGNSLDFRVMIHKIHDGANLPSVQAGTPYIIYGFQNSVNDFSDVVFPQDVRNCEKCHDAANPNTPDAANHFNNPSIQACGACHDDVDFAQGQAGGHPGGVVTDNSQCTVCHAAGRIAGSVEDSHLIPGKVAAAKFQYNILSITNTAPGQKPMVKFSVTNPQNNDQPYDLATDPSFTAAGGASRLAVDIAWRTTEDSGDDFGNEGSGVNPGQPVSINALTAATSNGDGTYTVTSAVPIPGNATGSGEVAIEGHPAGDFNGDGVYTDRVPVTSVIQYFPITDSTAVPRRAPVDVAKCQNCHGQNDGLSLHGNNRTDNVKLCVICHNPNDTDIAQRPIDPDATPNGVNTAAVDGLEQRPINFDRMIHSIHGADFRAQLGAAAFVIYGFGGSVNNFGDVGFPGILQDCNQCHQNNSYQLPLRAGLLGTTVDTHATEVANGSGGKMISPQSALQDVAAYSRITPIAAACSACHADAQARAHMMQNGGSFGATQSQIGTAFVESCSVCHEPGAIADVAKEHGLN
ncbi:MAG: OmcA/MtrC family decaheme c-type cytochrome [Gammaproteobacteria bacterium]|nr:OmcA/MtrC family decaheme c-type cytochrome [Gammaproteobacteria bacterium]